MTEDHDTPQHWWPVAKWQLYLSKYLDERPAFPNATKQVAEAIVEAIGDREFSTLESGRE